MILTQDCRRETLCQLPVICRARNPDGSYDRWRAIQFVGFHTENQERNDRVCLSAGRRFLVRAWLGGMGNIDEFRDRIAERRKELGDQPEFRQEGEGISRLERAQQLRLEQGGEPNPGTEQSVDRSQKSGDWAAKSVKFLVKRSIQDLPAPPSILTRILRETENEDTTATDLERLISSDQALAARVLKVVNSAYYGLSGQVSSLSQAVVILGVHQIRNLALSITSLSMIKSATGRQRDLQRRFWLHAIGTAIGAQIVGKRKNIGARCLDSAYVGGLLHDIGRLFLFTNFTETHLEIAHRAEREGRVLRDLETEVFGQSHEEIGAELARMWNFPTALVEVMEHHHGPFDAASDPRLLCVNVADATSENVFEGTPVDATLDPYAKEWSGLTEEEFAQLGQLVKQQVEACESVFLQAA